MTGLRKLFQWNDFGCLNCGFFLSKELHLCTTCEEQLNQWRTSRAYHLRWPEQTIPVYALFDWPETAALRVSQIIQHQKGGARPGLSEALARELFAFAVSRGLRATPETVIALPQGTRTPDHAVLLAEAISGFLGLSMIRLRQEGMALQTKALSREERRQKTLVSDVKITAKTPIIFVDDVLTTGSTARAAFNALGRPKQFCVLTVAWRLLEKPSIQ